MTTPTTGEPTREARSCAASADPLGARFALDVAVVVGVMLLALAVGATALRRRTP